LIRVNKMARKDVRTIAVPDGKKVEVEYNFSDSVAKVLGEFTREDMAWVRADPLTTHSDDRGHLFEVNHSSDVVKFGQDYVVIDDLPHIVRAFHAHRELWDYFTIIQGHAKFVLFDARVKIHGEENPTYGRMKQFVIGQRRNMRLTVPPGVYHGWMSLEPQTILLSFGSELYDGDDPDEHRVPPNSFGYRWEVEFK